MLMRNGRRSLVVCATICSFGIPIFPDWIRGEDQPRLTDQKSAEPAPKPENEKPAEKAETDDASRATKAADQRSMRRPIRMGGFAALIHTDSVLAELGIEKQSPEHQAILDVFKTFAMDLQKRRRSPTEQDRAQGLNSRDLSAVGEAELIEKVNKLLQPAQVSRMRQLLIQQWGVDSVNNADVANDLQITKGQQEKFAAIDTEFEESRRELRQTLRANGASFQESKQKIDGLTAERQEKYIAILTPSQLKKFDELKGAPFELKSPPRPHLKGARQGMPSQLQSGELMTFVLREPILKELGIKSNSPLIAEIRELAEAYRNESRAGLRVGLEKARSNDPADEFDPYNFGINLQAKYYPELQNLLTPEQFTRLQQIEWQYKGLRALDDPTVSDALELSQEQREKLDLLAREVFQQQQVHFVFLIPERSGTASYEDANKKVQELSVEWKEKSDRILTTDQQEKFSQLKGEPFDLTQLRSRRRNPAID